MNLLLKECQETAVEDMVGKAINLLRKKGKRLLFKAPTGAGKTIVTAEFLRRLVCRLGKEEDMDKKMPLSFVWLAPGGLHQQSCEKLERYYDGRHNMKCSCSHVIPNEEIDENEIWFFNWESVRLGSKNLFRHENEDGKFLDEVLKRTQLGGREIVLVIDESHYHAQTEISQEFIEMVSPRLIVEVTATPNHDPYHEFNEKVEIDIEDARKDGLIKKSVMLNNGIGNFFSEEDGAVVFTNGAVETLLECAMEKRNAILAAYENLGIDINPLICIQLPDNLTREDEEMRSMVQNALLDRGFSTEQGNLAIWLTEENQNRADLEDDKSGVDILLFKQAIARGWDCPRAHILLLLRNWKGNAFSVQTLGRIMRMPEQKHYGCPILDNAYVYTDREEVRIDNEIAGDYLHLFSAKRVEEYSRLQLKSASYPSRKERQHLPDAFVDRFLSMAEQERLAVNVDTESSAVYRGIIEETQIEDADTLAEKPVGAKGRRSIDDEWELQQMFNSFLSSALTDTTISPGAFPDADSLSVLKEALYEFFKTKLNRDYGGDQFKKILSIVLNEGNRRHFERVIGLSKAPFAPQNNPVEFDVNESWEVQESASYGSDYTERAEIKKSVLMPFYSATMSKPEKSFIAKLEGSQNVRWWHKNGNHGSQHFAVPYEENGVRRLFYVDFIVLFADGKIGLYDTKEGETLYAAGNKSDGLLKYLTEENERREKKALPQLKGGIVKRTQSDIWMAYNGAGSKIAEKGMEGWNVLGI